MSELTDHIDQAIVGLEVAHDTEGARFALTETSKARVLATLTEQRLEAAEKALAKSHSHRITHSGIHSAPAICPACKYFAKYQPNKKEADQ